MLSAECWLLSAESFPRNSLSRKYLDLKGQ